MESLISGTSLEALLQESQQHTILLSDIRENSEAARKTDEHSLEQLRKLQQAAADTLEVAKSHKKQSKDESNTLKLMHETTVNANAIVAKRQTSVLNTLCKTVDMGFSVANQKMFDVIEKLGVNLANAFSSVGHSLENKLYSFFGELSFMIKPIVGIVKIGFSVLKKIIEVPLKMLWEGFKAFNETIIGKLITLGLMIWGFKKFFTSTKFGQKISEWIQKKKGEPNSVIGSFFNKLEEIITWIKVCAGAKIFMDVSNFFYKGAGRGMLSWFGKALKTILPAGFFSFFKNLGKKGTGKVLTGEVKNLPTKRITDPRFLLPGPSNTATAAKTASTASNLIKDAEIVKDASKTASIAKNGLTALKSARYLKSFSGSGLAGLGVGLGLDYAADQVDNKTGKGLLQVLSAAGEMGLTFLPFAATGAGAVVPIAAAIIGAAGSLLFGEGGKNLFGSDDENVQQQNTDLTMLNELQKAQQQAATAEIRSMNDVAESIREQNRTMIQVAEKISTDAQYNINRRESTTQEAARHEDAKEQQKLTSTTNTTLQAISDTLTTLSSNIQTMLASAGGNTNNARRVSANVGSGNSRSG